MTNIEKNALRIAELMGWEHNPIFNRNTKDCIGFKDAVQIKTNEELIELYCLYNGLMSIVFECNNSSPHVKIFRSLYYNAVVVYLNTERCCNYFYKTEPEYIEALQLAVIKYLELKNV